jgi:hypothetical protein
MAKKRTKSTPKKMLIVTCETAGLPLMAICSACRTQFETAPENRSSLEQAKYQLGYEFNRHECKPLDSSQNALRIVREATEGK